MDFDHTLAVSRSVSGESMSTWAILEHFLPEKARNEYRSFYLEYWPLEAKNQLTVEDAAVWWESIIGILFLNLYP